MSSKNKLSLLKNASSNAKEEICISLVGPVGCGKSALIVKYLTRRFIGEYDPLYEGCWTKQESIDNSDINIQLMDTFDKERKYLEKYVKWSDCLILVYSIIDKQSFIQIQDYLESTIELVKKLQEDSNEKNEKKFTKIVLLGTKIDMERYRQVNKQDVDSLIRKCSNSSTNSLNKINDSTNTIINDLASLSSSSTSSSLNNNINIVHMETTSCEEYDLVQNLFHKLIKETKREKEIYLSHNHSTNNTQNDENTQNQSFKLSKSKFMNSSLTSSSKFRAKSPKQNQNTLIIQDSSNNLNNSLFNSLSNNSSTNSSQNGNVNLSLVPFQSNNSALQIDSMLNSTNSINSQSQSSPLNSNYTNTSPIIKDVSSSSSSKKNSSKFPFFTKILNKS